MVSPPPLLSLVCELRDTHKFIHLARAPFLLVAEDLTVERDIAVLDRQPDQPALLYAALDRVPRQKGHAPVNLEHTDEQRGISALERSSQTSESSGGGETIFRPLKIF